MTNPESRRTWAAISLANRSGWNLAALVRAEIPCLPRCSKDSAEALRTFETAGGFRLELVAAEPMVHSPVAAAYDEDGNLYVAEMTDYPYKPRPPQRSNWSQRGKCRNRGRAGFPARLRTARSCRDRSPH